MRPVQPIQPVRPVQPVQPVVRPIQPVQSIQPVRPVPVFPQPTTQPITTPSSTAIRPAVAPLPTATPIIAGGGIMGQLARGRIGAAPISAPMQAGSTAVPQVTIVQENEETLMRSLKAVWPGTNEQIATLLAATYNNSTPIISMNRRDILTEVLNMIIADGFDATLKFIRNAPNPEFILWEQSSMDEARTKLNREITIQQADEVGVKGIGKCRYCASKELIFSMKQLRSGDEPMTVFVRCVLCNKQWRE